MDRLRQGRKASTLFIFITLVIDAIGIGIIIPVLPDVIRRFVTEEASVSRLYGIFIASYALLQFVASPILGRLSDRYGRRPILLISLLGAAVDYGFMAFAPTLPLLFVGRLISGISGASYTVATAYIADISDDSNRSKNFGMIGAGFGLGFIIGPALGGLIASHGIIYPFLLAAAFNLLNFAFGFFVLPESLAPKLRRSFDRGALNPFRSLKALSKMHSVRALVVVYMLMALAGQTHPSIWTIYTEHRFGWTPTEVGVSLTVVGVLSAIAQGALTGPLVKRFGEKRVMTVGCFGEAIGFLGFGLASSGAMLYGVLIFSSLFWAAHPAIQSIISREVPANEQGELQGALMSVTSLMAILNPVIMTNLFAITSDAAGGFYLPGSPYILAGSLFFIAWLLILHWSRSHSGGLAESV